MIIPFFGKIKKTYRASGKPFYSGVSLRGAILSNRTAVIKKKWRVFPFGILPPCWLSFRGKRWGIRTNSKTSLPPLPKAFPSTLGWVAPLQGNYLLGDTCRRQHDRPRFRVAKPLKGFAPLLFRECLRLSSCKREMCPLGLGGTQPL